MLKSLASLSICGSQSSFRHKTPKLYCPKHPHLTITFFCLKTNCTSPYVCSQCKSSHPPDHKEMFKKVSSIYSGKFITQYAKQMREDFSSAKMASSCETIIRNLTKIEEEVISIIRGFKEQVEARFEAFQAHIGHHRQLFQSYTDHMQASLKKKHLDTQEITQLVRSYKRLKEENIKTLSHKIDELPSLMSKDTKSLISDMQSRLSEILEASLSPISHGDFSKLKVVDSINYSQNFGVLYGACAHIPNSSIIVAGISDRVHGSLGMIDLQTKKLVATLNKVHNGVIIHVIWIENKNYVVSAAFDNLIKVHHVIPEKRQMKTVRILRGHPETVRVIK